MAKTRPASIFLILAFTLVFTEAGEPYNLTCENYDHECPDTFHEVDCFGDMCGTNTAASQECDELELSCYQNFCGGCYTICCGNGGTVCDPSVTFTCPDGSTVTKDPDTNCASFFACGACAAELLLCTDGYTQVHRDPDNNCRFERCPAPFVPTCATRDDACAVSGVPDFESACLYPPCDERSCAAGETCYNAYCGGCNALCCDTEL